jgi:hypothetical protein
MHYGYLLCSELGIKIFSKLFLEYVVYEYTNLMSSLTL